MLEKKENIYRNKYYEINANLEYIKYITKAIYINVLKELDTNDINFNSLKNNYDYMILEANFRRYNYLLKYIFSRIGLNELYNKNKPYNPYRKFDKDIWNLWYNSNFLSY